MGHGGHCASPQYDCNLEEPTVAEIETVVRVLKNGRAVGEDYLLPEVFKFSLETIFSWLRRGYLEIISCFCLLERGDPGPFL